MLFVKRCVGGGGRGRGEGGGYEKEILCSEANIENNQQKDRHSKT